MILVDKDFVSKLVNKYSEGIPYTQEELGNFYYKETDGSYVVCCNDGGDCFMEDFKLYSSVLLYFNSGLDLQEIYDNEEERLRYIDRWSHKIATYIFCETSRETSSCTWFVDFEDINSFYGIKLESDIDLLEAVQRVLDTDFVAFIADYYVTDEGFDMNLWTNYCCCEVDGEDELWEEE